MLECIRSRTHTERERQFSWLIRLVKYYFQWIEHETWKNRMRNWKLNDGDNGSNSKTWKKREENARSKRCINNCKILLIVLRPFQCFSLLFAYFLSRNLFDVVNVWLSFNSFCKLWFILILLFRSFVQCTTLTCTRHSRHKTIAKYICAQIRPFESDFSFETRKLSIVVLCFCFTFVDLENPPDATRAR